ncbi:MAG: ABC transporter substrate-binding protein [Caldimonas sp.]
MIQRREIVSALLSASLLAPLKTVAQQPRKVWRVGYLSAGARSPDGAPPAAFRQALNDLGYVDGQNVTYIGRWAEGKIDRLSTLASELVGMKADAIVAFGGGPAAQALKRTTSSIPIVFAGAGDPVGVGLVDRLSHPGGNVTGISAQATELSAKRLELLKAMVPRATRIAVLWNADDPAMTLRYQQIERAAPVLGVTLQALGVREPDDFEVAFSTMLKERPEGLLLVTDSLTSLNRQRVIGFAAEQNIPVMYEFGYLVRDGGLMSYGPDDADTLRRAAQFVDKILKGTKPGDLPVEQPTRYYLVLNLKTARGLRLTVPQSILLSADEVIPQ